MAGFAAARARVRFFIFAFLALCALPLPALADMYVEDWRHELATKEEAYNDCMAGLEAQSRVGHTNFVSHGCTLGTHPSYGGEWWVGFAEWDSDYWGPIDMYGYSKWRDACPTGENWSDALHACDPRVDGQGNFHVQLWGSYHSTYAEAMSECLRKMATDAPIHNTNYVGGTCHDGLGVNDAPAVVVTAEWDSDYYGHVIGHGYDMYATGGPPPPPPPTPPANPNLGSTCHNAGGSPSPSPAPKCGDPIHTATGNENLRETDYVGTGLLRFERDYNSFTSAPSHLLGPHWSNSLGRKVDVVDASTVIVRRADGAGFTFTLSGGAWTAPTGVFTRLTRLVDGSGNLAGWTYMEQDAREVENFDSLGRLSSIVRSNGEKVTLVYNYGFIEAGPNDYLPTSITDQSGRTLSLSYTNQLLTQLSDPSGATYSYAYDASGHLTTVTYPGGTTRTYLYNESAYTGGANLPDALTGIVDEKNQRFATIWYSTDGRAYSSELAGGVDKYSITFNANGTSSITSPSGGVQQQTFNSGASVTRISGITEVANGQTRTRSWTFDSAGNVDLATDAAGTTRDYDYNARGLQTQRVDSANVAATKRTTQTDWNPTFNVPSEVRLLDAGNALDSKATFTYNPRGQVATSSVVNLTNAALTQTTTYTYCEQSGVDAGTCPIVGLLLSVNGPRTDVSDVVNLTYRQTDDAACASAPTTCAYRKGDLWKATNALGRATEVLKYDGARRPLSTKDANGLVTDLEYNVRGWLTARKVRGADNNSETDDAITRIDYEATGVVSKMTQPDGSFFSFTYDAAHRLTDVTDALGNKIHYALDNAGKRIQEDTSNAGGVKRSLSRVFDTLGQLKTLADGYSTPTDFTYDVNGSLNTTTDPLSRVSDRDVDALGRLKQVIANTGGGTSDKATTQFGYDARDNLRSIVDPKGLTTGYAFDSTNNLTQLTSPDTGSTIYGYDAAGNRTSEMKADGVTEGFVYDVLGRLAAMTYAHSTNNVTFAYDTTQTDCAVGETFGIGHLTKVTDGSGSTRLCYDQRGNLVRKVQTVTGGSTLTVGATYNAAGRLVAMTYPSGAVVTYLRDAGGKITRVDAKPTATSAQVTLVGSAAYLPFGPLNSLTFGNGRALTKAYDRNYAVDSVTDSASSNPLSQDFTVNSVGNVTGLTERTGPSTMVTRSFTYDGLDRLTAQKNGASTVEAFTYNSTGDRLSKTAGSTANYTYAGTNHRLTAVASTSRTYSATGETKTIGNRNYTYDERHRLISTAISGTPVTYMHNGIGQRVSKKTGNNANTLTQFVYDDGGHLIGEYSNTGVRAKEYVWLDDTLVAVLGSFDGTTYQFVETDHLGTPRAVVQPTKNVIVWRWDVNPTAFGEHAPNANPDGDSLSYTMNLRFPGQYYDSETGTNYNHFRDYDAASGRYIESDPIGLLGGVSSYGYSFGNPLTFTDPFGLRPPTPEESAFLASLFGECLTFNIEERYWGDASVAMSYGNTISMPNAAFKGGNIDNGIDLSKYDDTVAHEGFHVWQRSQGANVTMDMAGPQVGGSILGSRDPLYQYNAPSGPNPNTTVRYFDGLFDSRLWEAQAQMWEDSYKHQNRGWDDAVKFGALVQRVGGANCDCKK